MRIGNRWDNPTHQKDIKTQKKIRVRQAKYIFCHRYLQKVFLKFIKIDLDFEQNIILIKTFISLLIDTTKFGY